jgi:hypothetical protein
MSEPTVSYPLRDVLDRIEARIAQIDDHVRNLETGSAVNSAATAAALARRAVLIAAGSPIVAVLLTWWLTRK